MAERAGIDSDRVREFVLVPVNKYQKMMEGEGGVGSDKKPQAADQKDKEEDKFKDGDDLDRHHQQQSKEGPGQDAPADDDDDHHHHHQSGGSRTPGGSGGGGGGGHKSGHPPSPTRPGINSGDGSSRVTPARAIDPSGQAANVSGGGEPPQRSTTAAAAPATTTGAAGQNGSAGPSAAATIPSSVGVDGGRVGSSKAQAKRKGATLADRRKRMRDMWLSL